METYKQWVIFHKLPEGWIIDKSLGSPLHGHVFISDGKSVLRGGVRALMKLEQNKAHDFHITVKCQPDLSLKIEQKPNPSAWTYEANSAKNVNDLARAKFKERILKDILCDLTICEIEGWDKSEYIRELQDLIRSIQPKKGY